MQKPAIAGANRGYPKLNAASSSVTSRIASARALSSSESAITASSPSRSAIVRRSTWRCLKWRRWSSRRSTSPESAAHSEASAARSALQSDGVNPGRVRVSSSRRMGWRAISRAAQALRAAGRIDDAGLAQVLGEAVRIGRGLRVAEPGSEARGGPVRGRRLEERAEGLFHPLAMRIDGGRERVVIGEVHRLGDRRAMFGLARQRLGLLVVVVLQPVLEPAKEIVGPREVLRPRGLDQPALGEGAQRRAGRREAQARVAPAADHLEELHGELDLANAPGADLDIVGLVPPDCGLEDARLQLAELLEHPEVEVAAVDQRVGTHARAPPRA